MVKIGLQTIHHWGKHIVVGGVYGRTFWMPQGKQGLVDRSTICALQMATNDDCYEMSIIRSCCYSMTCNAHCVLRLLQVVLWRVICSMFSGCCKLFYDVYCAVCSPAAASCFMTCNMQCVPRLLQVVLWRVMCSVFSGCCKLFYDV
jgi:hypothetical protein